MKDFKAIIDTPFAQLAISTQHEAQKVPKAPTLHEFVSGIDFLLLGSEKPFIGSEFTESLARDISMYLQNPSHQFEISFIPCGTEFQRAVWQVMQTIEAGSTLTYGEVASQLKSSPRAVGNACRRNPIPLLIPCHRIVAKNGLGGFAGQTSGDVFNIKSWLLTHEAGEITENWRPSGN